MPNSARERIVFVLIALAAAGRLLQLNWLHPVTWDEIEFFRATDWVRQGLVPYRDFWEHHSPLQWFLFAPIAALTHSPGVSAILLMRWAQVPLWIAAFVMLNAWMRDAGVSPVARASAILLTVCSSMFELGALEYRVDVLGIVLYVAALFCLQRLECHRAYAFAAGAALCLAGFANLRIGPLAVLTLLVPRVVQPRERRWSGRPAADWAFIGAAVTFAIASVYFVATHSALLAFRRAWSENYLADRLQPGISGILWQRFIVPFGFNALDPLRSRFQWAAVDLPSIAIFIVGTIGVVRVLTQRFRTPDEWFVLAFFHVSSILFICAMKYVHYYHFEIIFVLMTPFVAMEIDRLVAIDRWRVVAACLMIATVSSLFASIFRGKEEEMAYEDFVMREVDRRTPVGSAVFDGVGRPLRRRPAYGYWFLPALVQVLESRGIFNGYDMASEAPAAIIADYRVVMWFRLHPSLGAFATKHYVPIWRNLWLPGMSAVVDAAHPVAQWIVPATGTYRVYASERLATHPWFRAPVTVGCFEIPRQYEVALRGFPDPATLPLTFDVDGQPARDLKLMRKQRLRVVSRSPRRLGLIIVRDDVRELFRQPAAHVDIDSYSPIETHIPRFPNLW